MSPWTNARLRSARTDYDFVARASCGASCNALHVLETHVPRRSTATIVSARSCARTATPRSREIPSRDSARRSRRRARRRDRELSGVRYWNAELEVVLLHEWRAPDGAARTRDARRGARASAASVDVHVHGGGTPTSRAPSRSATVPGCRERRDVRDRFQGALHRHADPNHAATCLRSRTACDRRRFALQPCGHVQRGCPRARRRAHELPMSSTNAPANKLDDVDRQLIERRAVP